MAEMSKAEGASPKGRAKPGGPARADKGQLVCQIVADGGASERETARAEMERKVNLVLSDGFMIFLAILMVPIILLPLAFPGMPGELLNFLTFSDVIILLLFVMEYFVKLGLAKDKWAHFKDPWHLLDLVIIIIPLFELTPIFVWLGYDLGGKSPLLRLLRLARLAAVGSRSLKRKIQGSETDTVKATTGPPVVRALEVDLETLQKDLDMKDFHRMVSDNVPSWIDVSELSDEYVEKVAGHLGIPSIVLSAALAEDSYPRVDHLEKHTLIYFIASDIDRYGESRSCITISRRGLLVICSGTDIVTVTRRENELFKLILDETRMHAKPGEPLTVAVLFSTIKYILDGYKRVLREVEDELIRLENLPKNQVPRDFLEYTFQLKKDVSRLVSCLSHLKEIMNLISTHRVTLAGFDKSYEEIFDVLKDEVEYLHETATEHKENLISLIDLHINKTSYEMNQVMKVIAIFTVVAVIPSLVGGMLGMNVGGIPGGIYLWQILIYVAAAMLGISYVFIKLGWLKS
jgi:Mg2+ and Co2+ transporter CorA